MTLSFLQSGWFWLLVGSLLLLIAGCALLPKKAPADIPASPHPMVTLTVVPFSWGTPHETVLQPEMVFSFTPSPTRIHRQLGSPDDDYYAENPNCYPSANGGYNCLGRVWNNSNAASGSILLSFKLQNQLIQSFSTEQRLIPSQSFAPYRLQIPPLSLPESFTASIEHALPNENYYKLTTVNSHGEMSEAGRYQLSTTIVNEVGGKLENIRIFATLVDEEQHLIGYRIYEVGDSLDNQEQQYIEMEIIPQELPDIVQFEIHAEGRLVQP